MAYYPQQQLVEGEEIIAKAIPFYWWFFLRRLILIGICYHYLKFSVSFKLCLAIIAVDVFIRLLSNQIVLTNKRIIGKYGFIIRTTIDIPLSRISSVMVDQSILGRMFGYGSIILNGVGGEIYSIPDLSDLRPKNTDLIFISKGPLAIIMDFIISFLIQVIFEPILPISKANDFKHQVTQRIGH